MNPTCVYLFDREYPIRKNEDNKIIARKVKDKDVETMVYGTNLKSNR